MHSNRLECESIMNHRIMIKRILGSAGPNRYSKALIDLPSGHNGNESFRLLQDDVVHYQHNHKQYYGCSPAHFAHGHDGDTTFSWGDEESCVTTSRQYLQRNQQRIMSSHQVCEARTPTTRQLHQLQLYQIKILWLTIWLSGGHTTKGTL